MYKSLLMFVFLSSSVLVMAQNDITGTWNTGKQNTIVEITEAEGAFSGQIVASENPKAKIGKQIIRDVKLDGDKMKGQLYAAKRDKWLNVVLLRDEDILKLKVKAGPRKKTVEWTRVEEGEH